MATSCLWCGLTTGPHHPCPACGGHAGHTLACPHGPGPAEAPSAAEILGVAAVLEWPAVKVEVPGRSPLHVPARERAWRLTAAWAERHPPVAVALLEGLEAFERCWRAQAPTPEEVTTA